MSTRLDCASNPRALLLAVLSGAACGAVAMALATPKTGREVRSTLRDALRFRRFESTAGDAAWDPEALEGMFI